MTLTIELWKIGMLLGCVLFAMSVKWMMDWVFEPAEEPEQGLVELSDDSPWEGL